MARTSARCVLPAAAGVLLPGTALAQEIPRVNVSVGGARGPQDVAAMPHSVTTVVVPPLRA